LALGEDLETPDRLDFRAGLGYGLAAMNTTADALHRHHPTRLRGTDGDRMA